MVKAIITATFEIEIDVPNEYYPPSCDTDEKRLAYELDAYVSGALVTTYEKDVYDSLCKMLSASDIDFVSGDIDPHYPNEPYYVELNGL